MPTISDKNAYQIGEAASILCMSRNTLRIHAENGYIKCQFTPVGRRSFTGKQIKDYWRTMMYGETIN